MAVDIDEYFCGTLPSVGLLLGLLVSELNRPQFHLPDATVTSRIERRYISVRKRLRDCAPVRRLFAARVSSWLGALLPPWAWRANLHTGPFAVDELSSTFARRFPLSLSLAYAADPEKRGPTYGFGVKRSLPKPFCPPGAGFLLLGSLQLPSSGYGLRVSLRT